MTPPRQVPVMILQNVILFPQAMLPLYIFEPRYRRMIKDVLEGERLFALAMRQARDKRERPEAVAGLGLVRACVTHDDGTSHLVLQGLARVRIERTLKYRPYRVCEIAPLAQGSGSELAVQALSARLLELVRTRLSSMPASAFADLSDPETPATEARSLAVGAFRKLLDHLNSVSDPEQVVDLVSATMLPDPTERQLILQTPDLEVRLQHLIRLLRQHLSKPNSEDPSIQ